MLTLGLKSGAWLATGSVGLMSDALESLVNLAAGLLAVYSLRLAAQPPDEGHPLGHGKVEYFTSGIEGALILFAAGGILLSALPRLLHPLPVSKLDLGLVLSMAATAINALVGLLLIRVGRRHESVALEADGQHLMTDVWTSVGVVVGVALVGLSGWLWLDPLVAMGVALNILREGAHLVWRSSQGLMDEALEPDVMAQIERTLHEFAHPTIRFDHVSSRRSGQRRFVDLHMHMPGNWSLGRAAALRSSVEQALMSAVPGLRATIQLLPMNVESHFDDVKDLK